MQTHFKLYTLIIDHDLNLLMELEGARVCGSPQRPHFTSAYPPISYSEYVLLSCYNYRSSLMALGYLVYSPLRPDFTIYSGYPLISYSEYALLSCLRW